MLPKDFDNKAMNVRDDAATKKSANKLHIKQGLKSSPNKNSSTNVSLSQKKLIAKSDGKSKSQEIEIKTIETKISKVLVNDQLQSNNTIINENQVPNKNESNLKRSKKSQLKSTEVALTVVTSFKKSKKIIGETEEETRWFELKEKYKNVNATSYKLTESYEEKTPIDHKILGWGFILSVVNDRLEVLFRSGIKHLISNYKSNK